MEPREAGINKWNRRRDAVGVVYVPVGLAGCKGVIRFTVVEQDVRPLLPVGIMRTLQASLDLNDDGDKVIFRQFGGESSLRTLQRGHTVIRADQFDPDGWQLPEFTELCQNNDEGRATNNMSSLMRTRDPDAVADHGKKQHRTATGLPDLIRPIFPRPHLGSRVVHKCTVLFQTMSGMCR